MYRFLFRPKWLAFHLLVVGAVVLMVNLGFWQLHRLQDRRDFNTQVESRSSQPAAGYTTVAAAAATDPQSVAWRTVEVTGTYAGDDEVVIINRSQGGIVGRHVVTPLRIDGGATLLVNRGFVQEGAPIPEPPADEVTISGRVRATERRRLGGLTDPAGELTEFQRIDIKRISDQLPGEVEPVYLELLATAPAPTATPAPVPPPELTEGSHLSYMMQWWVFSIAVIVGWVLAIRRSAAQRRMGLSGRAEVVSATGGSADAGPPPPTADEPATARS